LENSFPPIPEKRYFTISEVSKLCGVKPHVLRYWEQEFTQLRPMKRRGNRRYYQLHEVKLIRKIRQLLYEQGFTIVGARNKLQELLPGAMAERLDGKPMFLPTVSQAKQNGNASTRLPSPFEDASAIQNMTGDSVVGSDSTAVRPLLSLVRQELINIRDLLGPTG
jgi:DNA-binding transcriptional MerR regulator